MRDAVSDHRVLRRGARHPVSVCLAALFVPPLMLWAGAAVGRAWPGAALTPTDSRSILLYAWLEQNAASYGFSRPYRGEGDIIDEPWHWLVVPTRRPLGDRDGQ